MVFELLDERIRKGLEKLGIRDPLETQKLTIPKVLEGKNVLLIAPTGSGKTEAAILPSFHLLLNKYKDEYGIKILYITPLRSLNRDLLERFKFWEAELGIKIDVRHGDTPSSQRSKQVRSPPDVLIVTPETLQAILPGKRLREILKSVKIVIIDELHELLDSKRGVQLTVGLERLVELAGDFQRIALSATIGYPELAAKFIFGNRDYEIIKAYLNKKYEIEVVYPILKEKIGNEIEEIPYPEVLARIKYILELINKYKKVLIFCNTRTTAEVLAHRLSLFSEKEIGVHHSSLSKYVRIFTEESFRKGNLQTIVATSSLELGIDIGDIELVIQYKSPKQVTRLLQRVGRAGHRLTEISRGIIIAEDFDDIVESSAIIKLAKQGYLEKPDIHYGALDVLAHQVVGILMDFGKVNFNDVYNIIRRAYPYFNLEPEKLDEVIRFLDKLGYLRYFPSDGNIKKTKSTWKYYYEHISMIPEESKFEVIDKSSGTSIGFLDEKFVAEYGIPGQKFIHKGSIWKIVEVTMDKVYVVPVKDIEGAIPTWVGEELPVPFDVAQLYGRIISGKEELTYVDENSKEIFYRTLEEQKHYEIPSDDKIIVEWTKDNITVIHACFGYKVNNTLCKLLTSYIVRYENEPVLSRFDAYRIIIYKRIDPIMVFYSIKSKEDMITLLVSEIERSTLFKWRFLHVCRRFGLISSYKDAKRKVDKLIEYLKNTVVYEETMNEVLLEKFDIDKTFEIIEKIKNGEIKVSYVTSEVPSLFAQMGLKEYKIEIHKPKDIKRLVKKFFVFQLQNYVVKMKCKNCGKEYLIRIKDVNDKFRCECGSGDFYIFVKEKEEKDMKKFTDELELRSELFKKYGKKALYLFICKNVKKEEYEKLLKLDENSLIEKLFEIEKKI